MREGVVRVARNQLPKEILRLGSQHWLCTRCGRVGFHWRLPDPTLGMVSAAPGVAQIIIAASVLYLSEREQAKNDSSGVDCLQDAFEELADPAGVFHIELLGGDIDEANLRPLPLNTI